MNEKKTKVALVKQMLLNQSKVFSCTIFDKVRKNKSIFEENTCQRHLKPCFYKFCIASAQAQPWSEWKKNQMSKILLYMQSYREAATRIKW